MTLQVTLEDALNQTPVTINTLDGRKITVAIDQQISPQACVQIENEGMPLESLA